MTTLLRNKEQDLCNALSYTEGGGVTMVQGAFAAYLHKQKGKNIILTHKIELVT
jgi:hypothetical protein